MCKSMTGYGVAEFFIGEDKLSLEMKSANHRFIEINIKLPDRFSILENKVRDVVKRHCARGSFYISIIYSGEISSALKVNIPLAKHYYGALKELQKGLGLEGEIDISMLLKFRDIFSGAGIKFPCKYEGGRRRDTFRGYLIKAQLHGGHCLKDGCAGSDCDRDV